MGGVLTKLMPSRTEQTPVRVVVDIDQILTERVGFNFRGKTYPINPVTTEQFMLMADILGDIQEMIQSQGKGAKLHDSQIYDAYYRYISVLCPTFTLELLKTMPLTGVHAVLNLIIKHVTGQPMNMDALEKKKMMGA